MLVNSNFNPNTLGQKFKILKLLTKKQYNITF